MKKTITVNIKGISFTIEEDAYELLQDYLDRLKSTLGNQSEANEILEDIEIRIAELFNMKLDNSKTVIEYTDVEQVLSTLGNPEDYVVLDDDEDEQEYQQKSYSQQHERRLFRDERNATIAGVCAGIANYFNIDVVIIRIIFVVIFLFAGFGIPLYIILWIVIPKAKTSIDRLRMKGRPITVETVKSEVENAADKIKSESKSFAHKVRHRRSQRDHVSKGARVLASIIGIGLIGFALINLIAFLIIVVSGPQIIPVQSDQGFMSLTQFGELVLSNSMDVKWAWIGGLMVSLSFILFFFLLGSILLFHLRNRWGKLSLLGLFLIGMAGVFICLGVAMRTTRDVAIDGEIERSVASSNSKELYVIPNFENLPSDGDFDIKSNGQFGLMTIDGKYIKEHGIRFEYNRSSDSLFHIYQNLSARSHSHTQAVNKSKNIQHNVWLKGDSLFVDTDYAFPQSDKLRDQDVTIIIEIPEGGSVKFKNQTIDLEPKEGDREDDFRHYYRQDGRLRGNGEYDHWDHY